VADVSVGFVIVESEGRGLGALAQRAGLPVAGVIPVSGLGGLDRGRPAPEMLAVDLRGQSSFPAELVAFKRRHPRTGVMIVVDELDPSVMLEGMRAGVTEVVPEPVSVDALVAAFGRLSGQVMPAGVDGRSLLFVGAKGGVGTTTVAVNVALAMATTRRGGVLLVDLHLSGPGDAAIFLGVEPHFSIIDALENVNRLDGAFLRSLVVRSKGGLDVLAAPPLALARVATPQEIRTLAERLTANYDVVVFDVSHSDFGVVDAVEPVAAVTLVLNQELPTVRRATQLATLLRQRHGKDRVGTVVSRYDPRAEIGQEDIERVVGLPVRSVLPSDYRRAVMAANAGRPLVSEGGTRLASALQELARRLDPGVSRAAAAAAPRTARRAGGLF
jgi:pilus assembly protein CpaE